MLTGISTLVRGLRQTFQIRSRANPVAALDPMTDAAGADHQAEELSRSQLVNKLAMKVLRQLDEALDSDQQITALRQRRALNLLLDQSPVSHTVAPTDLVLLLDDVLTAVSQADATSWPQMVFTGPTQVQLDATALGRLLVELLLGADLQAVNQISTSYQDGVLRVRFPGQHQPKFKAHFESLAQYCEADWADQALSLDAFIGNQPQAQLIQTAMTALVVAESDIERLSLAHRLQLLGVSAVSDFTSPDIDFCLAADDQSHAFRAVLPYVEARMPVLLVRGRTLRESPAWVHLAQPLHQQDLAYHVQQLLQAKQLKPASQVLIVDDSPGNAHLLEQQVRELGHEAVIAASGGDAVLKAQQLRFNMIFMDMQMPGMNGLEAGRQILLGRPGQVIYALTAHATQAERRQWTSAGFTDVLIKPVRLDKLRQLFNRHRPGTNLPPAGAPGGATLDVFDPHLALSNANDRPDVAAELLVLLVESLPRELAQIISSINDLQALQQAVHKLHGAVRYTGVPRISQVVSRLELAIKKADEDEIKMMINLLGAEVDRLIGWYREHPDVFTSTQKTTA